MESVSVKALEPDQPGHPGNSNLNFWWLYITIAAIFLLSVGVKIMTVFLKRWRDKKRDPDLERQALEPFQRFWFPWRYDKYGNRIDPKQAKAIADAKKAAKHGSAAVSSDAGTASPLMSGALGPDSSPYSPIQMQPLDLRVNSAFARDTTSTASLLSSPGLNPSNGFTSDSSTGKDHAGPVNPYSSNDGNLTPHNIPQSEADTDDWNTPARSPSNATGHGFSEAQFERSLAHEGYDSGAQSSVDTHDFAQGYGSSTGSGNPFETPVKSRDDRREKKHTGADKHHVHGLYKDQRQRDLVGSSRDTHTRRTKEISSSSRDEASRCTPSHAQSSRQQAPSSRIPSSTRGHSQHLSGSSSFYSQESASSSQATPSEASRTSRAGKFAGVFRENKIVYPAVTETKGKEAEKADKKQGKKAWK